MFRLASAATILGAVLMASGPSSAQVKPKRCLSGTEVATEQLIRHGVFLREASGRCDEYTPGTKAEWTKFDEANADRLRKQTDKRAKFFAKEFKADAQKVMTYFDGRLVTYHRFVPITPAYCRNVQEMLKEIGRRGWGAFTNQAKVVQNEVYLDYKICQ